jgi:hypothetical protein
VVSTRKEGEGKQRDQLNVGTHELLRGARHARPAFGVVCDRTGTVGLANRPDGFC